MDAGRFPVGADYGMRAIVRLERYVVQRYSAAAMDLLLFGIQGGGKGTQAKKLATAFGFHHFEAGAELRGIIASGRNDSRTFDAQQLDRLDFMVAELKKRGIYVDLNLNVG